MGFIMKEKHGRAYPSEEEEKEKQNMNENNLKNKIW